jgi:hypothetical protein
MGPEILSVLLTAIASLLAPLGYEVFRELLKIFGWREQKKPVPYSERLSGLTGELVKASKEVDSVLAELAQVAKEREQTVQKMEGELSHLQNREKELQQRIDHLQNVPLPVAEYFAQLTSTGEKRSARRDYLLFGAGVVVSTGIAILLKIFGLG